MNLFETIYNIADGKNQKIKRKKNKKIFFYFALPKLVFNLAVPRIFWIFQHPQSVHILF